MHDLHINAHMFAPCTHATMRCKTAKLAVFRLCRFDDRFGIAKRQRLKRHIERAHDASMQQKTTCTCMQLLSTYVNTWKAHF